LRRPADLSRASALLGTGEIRGVLFDMDGLLLDSERLYSQAFHQACDELGYAVDEQVWLSCIGTTGAASRSILEAGMPEGFPLDTALDRFRALFGELSAGGIDPRPGAVELLVQLHDWGVPLGLVTSTQRVLAGEKLYRARLGDYFAVRVCGGESSHGKPHPAPFKHAARLLDQPIEDCLVLEDSANGVRAGVAAGAQVIQVPDLVPPSDELKALGHTVTESLADVLKLLSRSRD